MDTAQTETDVQLLARFSESNDEDAFRAIVERHTSKVHACCLRILRDSHASDDATQATFLLLAQKARSLSKDAVLAGWLYRTATWTAMEARRALATRNRREQHAGAPKTNPATERSDEQLRAELSELLGALPAVQRDAIVLHFLDGRSEADVAAEFGCPPATVGTRIARGLAKLREGLQRRGYTVAAPFVPVLIRQFAQHVAPTALIHAIRLTAPGLTTANLHAVEIARHSTRAATGAAARGKLALAIGAVALIGAATATIYTVYQYNRPAPVAALPGPDLSSAKVLWDVTLDGNTASHLIAGNLVLLSIQTKEKSWIEARSVIEGARIWSSPAPVLSPSKEPVLSLSKEPGTLCYVAGDSVVCTQGAEIFSIDLRSGAERWRLRGDTSRPHSPLIGEGADVFTVAAQKDGAECSVCCLNPLTGETLWEVPASIGGVSCAPCADHDNVYAAGEAGIVCVSRREQRVLWSQKTGAIAAPACVPGHVIIPGAELTCLSAKSGKWSWSVPGHLETSPLTLSAAAAYTGLQRVVTDSSVREGQAFTYAAVNPEDGSIAWERVFPAEVRAGAAVTTHSVYVTCWDDGLYCLNREDGTVRWRLSVPLNHWSPTPLLLSDRMLVCFQNKVMCVGQ